MQKIVPFLWFHGRAEEAAEFYTSIFEDTQIRDVSRYGEDSMGKAGSVMSATFVLAGQEFIALNGGPQFSFTPAVSFFVRCDDQAEVDKYWDRLLEGGKAVQCGWLQDKFGLSWQIVPNALGEMLSDDDDEKSGRVMEAMMKMVKLDIATLRRAYDGHA